VIALVIFLIIVGIIVAPVLGYLLVRFAIAVYAWARLTNVEYRKEEALRQIHDEGEAARLLLRTANRRRPTRYY